jgi:hypothetical protein
VNATVRYLRSLEEIARATVDELVDHGEPMAPNDGPERPRRKVKVGSHAQAALTKEQRKRRAKTNRRNARKARGTSDDEVRQSLVV